MSDTQIHLVNTRPSLRLQLEQMLGSDPIESDCASSPPESVADSLQYDDQVQSQYDEGEVEAPGDEGSEADEDLAAQMMDMGPVVEQERQSEVQSASGHKEHMKALVGACTELNTRVEFTEKCCKDQRSWNDEMQSSAEGHRSRQAAVEKKLATVEAALANLMSRMAVMEGNTDETGEHSGKANPKKNRKQSGLKRQIDV